MQALTTIAEGGTKRGMKRLDALTVPFNPRHRQKDEHFTHPAVNRVQVHNSSASCLLPLMPFPYEGLVLAFQCSSSVTIKPDDLWTDLHDADDSHHPGNRPGGIEHSTLHPQPSACPRIRSPHSHHVRLNPYLQHHCNGPHPITFDITRGSKGITHTTHAPSTTPLDLAHLSQQPATYPSITRMHIQPVAEDPLPHFPWPIEVVNAHGITCGDVFDAIARKFLEHVSEQEYNNWTRHRQSMAARTYHQRVGTLADPTKLDEVQEACEGLRCIDYVGGKVVFHGLEQACATMGDTWFMYLGAGEGSGM